MSNRTVGDLVLAEKRHHVMSYRVYLGPTDADPTRLFKRSDRLHPSEIAINFIFL